MTPSSSPVSSSSPISSTPFTPASPFALRASSLAPSASPASLRPGRFGLRLRSGAAGLLAAGAFLLGFTAPAFGADQTEPSCAGLPPGEYANPNDARTFYACGTMRPAEERACEADGTGERLFFVEGSGSAPAASRCDRAASAPSDRTPTLTAGQARATTLYPYVVHGLTAVAEREDGGPLFGAKVTFTAADGTHLCSAYTDRNGKALCDSEPVSVNAQTLRLGYHATFAGSDDGTWNPAHAQGGITIAD